METWDILAATQELEESGMERNHADAIAATIAAATAPLATKADLAREIGQLECKLDAMDAKFQAMDAKFDSIDKKFTDFKESITAQVKQTTDDFKESIATQVKQTTDDFKESIAAQTKQTTDDFKESIAAQTKQTTDDFKASIAAQMEHMATKAELEALKVWILSSTLGATVTIITIMFLLLRLGV